MKYQTKYQTFQVLSVQMRVMPLVCLLLFLAQCAPKKAEEAAATSATETVSSKYLYVASGACYAGGNVTPTNLTSSNSIYRINTQTGANEGLIADFFASPSNVGDSPVGIVSVDSDWIYALVENTTTTALRRIEKIEKKIAGARQIFSTGQGGFTAQLRYLTDIGAGATMTTRSTGLEYITSGNSRIGAPYINPSAAPCATSNTLITKMIKLSPTYGRFLFLHAAAANNRFGIMSSAGGTACMTSGVQAAPVATAFPTAVVYDAANSRVLVAYAGTTTATNVNSIYTHTITETASTVTIGAGVKIYDASVYPATHNYLLYGISEMVLDASTNSLYVATAINTATTVSSFTIEKLNYDATKIGTAPNEVLTRPGNSSFYNYGTDTKCISQMMIAN